MGIEKLTETEETLPRFDDLWDYDQPDKSEGRFRDLLPKARASGDNTYLAELLTQIARSQGLQGRFDEAHTTLDEAEGLLALAGPRAEVRYLLERGRVFNSSRRPKDARPLFLEAWQVADAEGEDFYAVDALHMLQIVDPPEEGLEWAQKAMALAERSEDPRARGWLGSLYNNTGWTYHDMGRYEEALQTFQKGLEWQKQAGRERQAGIAAWTVGRALRSLGRYDQALEMQHANLRAREKAGEPDGYVHEELGECLLALNRREEASPHFARAYALLSQDPWLTANEAERLSRLERLASP